MESKVKQVEDKQKVESKDVFLKLYVEPIRQGQTIAKIGPKLYGVLIAVAAFMDDKGQCYPSQETLAKMCGCSRKTMNKYIRELLETKLDDGNPVLNREWDYYPGGIRPIYSINPNVGIGIFDFKPMVGNMGLQPWDNIDKDDITPKCPRVGNTGLQPHDNSDHNPPQSSQGLGRRGYKGVGNTSLQGVGNMGLHEEEPYKKNHNKEETIKNNITFGNAATPPPSKKGKNLYPIVNNKGNIDKDIVMDNNGNMNCTNSRYIDVNNVKDNSNNTVDCNNLNNKDDITIKDDNTNQSSQSKVVAEIENNLKERAKGSARAATKTEPEEKEKDRFKDWGINKPVTFKKLSEVYTKRHPEELKEIKKYVDNILANVENGQGLFIYGEETPPKYHERALRRLFMAVILTEYVKVKGEELSDGTPPVLMVDVLDEIKNGTFYQNIEQWKTVSLLALCQSFTMPSYRDDFNELIEYRQNNNLPTIYSSQGTIEEILKRTEKINPEKLDLIKVNKIVES